MVSAAVGPVVVILAALTRDKLKSWIAVVISVIIQDVTQCGFGSLAVSRRA